MTKCIYPIRRYGDYLGGIRYGVEIYSGSRRLNMLIDTGSAVNIITKDALAGCSYIDTGQKRGLRGIGSRGSLSAELVQLHFSLVEVAGIPAEDFPFSMEWFALPEFPDDKVCSDAAFSGVIGIGFLSNCCIDLAGCRLEVYWKDPDSLNKPLALERVGFVPRVINGIKKMWGHSVDVDYGVELAEMQLK